MTRIQRLSASTAVVAIVVTWGHAASAITVDGLLDPGEGYSIGFEIPFLDDKGNTIGGGQLWFGTNPDGTQAFYFKMPKEFVDNTYGTGSIGWSKTHTFDDLLGSDSLGTDSKKSGSPLVLFFNDGETQVVVDYIAQFQEETTDSAGKKITVTTYRSGGVGTDTLTKNQKYKDNEGDVIKGDASAILEIATSLEYNINSYASAHPDVIVNSPQATVNPDGSYTPVDPTFANWIYEVGYELLFAPGTFDPVKWTDPTLVLSLIGLGESHVSPSKEKFGGYGDATCIFGCSPSRQVDVPEPGTLGLLGAGLAAAAVARRRRQGEAASSREPG